jgi:phage gp37-like protein
VPVARGEGNGLSCAECDQTRRNQWLFIEDGESSDGFRAGRCARWKVTDQFDLMVPFVSRRSKGTRAIVVIHSELVHMIDDRDGMEGCKEGWLEEKHWYGDITLLMSMVEPTSPVS